MVNVSIIVAARNEEKHIAVCLKSLQAQSYKDFEILVVDGMSDDKTAIIAKKFARKDKSIKVFLNKHKRASEARNIGIKNSKGNYVGYIDAHTTASVKWLETLLNVFKNNSKWKGKVVGGVGSIHKNPDKNKINIAITQAFQHPLGGGGSSYRVKGKLRSVDTAYACLYTKEALNSIKRKNGTYYDPYFVKGQDADLNWRLNKKGFVLLQEPRAVTYYSKRGSINGFWRQMLVAGFWRAKLSLRHTNLFKPTFFLPLIAWLGFKVFIILGLVYANIFLLMAVCGLIVYLGAILILALRIPKAKIFLVGFLVIIIHLAFSIGLVKGFFSKHNLVRDRV